MTPSLDRAAHSLHSWRPLGWVWAVPFARALKARRLAWVRRLLSLGANPDQRLPAPGYPRGCAPAEPALVQAARANDTALVRVLLDAGADIEACDARSGHTALATAVLGRRWAAAEVLVDARASWDTPVRVIDAASLAGAMLMGGFDPSRVQSVDTTLQALMEGSVQDLANVLGQGWRNDAGHAHRLWARAIARQAAHRLDLALPGAPLASAPPSRARI